MSRLRADFLMLLVAVIWGGAFVAQKTQGLGPFGFTGIRFALSLMVVLPLAVRESRRGRVLTRRDRWQALILCAVFFTGVIVQQLGIMATTVTDAGFLTGLYVIMVPFVAAALFRRRPSWIVLPACVMAAAGTWLLGGGKLPAFGSGDGLILICALCFAVQLPLIGLLVQRTNRPLAFSAMQYAACAVCGLAIALIREPMTFAALRDSALPIGYAGLLSGGVAYTLQAVAQQHTPPADAAVILSGESLFAALFGALLLGEHLNLTGWAGAGLIVAAMLLVEIGAFLPGFIRRFQAVS